MLSGDWSPDVCSSDLAAGFVGYLNEFMKTSRGHERSVEDYDSQNSMVGK
jgi:hypothetical protein